MLTPSSEPSGDATERLRPRRGFSSASLKLATPGASAMRAAHAYLEGTYDSPGAAADAYGCQRQLVNYYVRKMANAGVTRSTSASSEARELEFNVEEETSAPPQDELAAYKEAYKYAGKMLRKVGRRKAAAMANEKYGVTLSACTAMRASQAQGASPVKEGRCASHYSEGELDPALLTVKGW